MPAGLTRPISIEELYPRDEENRYRIYAVIGDDRTILATAADGPSVGMALVTMHEDQQQINRTLGDLGRIGVLDTMPGGHPHPAGTWVVNPYDRRPA